MAIRDSIPSLSLETTTETENCTFKAVDGSTLTGILVTNKNNSLTKKIKLEQSMNK